MKSRKRKCARASPDSLASLSNLIYDSFTVKTKSPKKKRLPPPALKASSFGPSISTPFYVRKAPVATLAVSKAGRDTALTALKGAAPTLTATTVSKGPCSASCSVRKPVAPPLPLPSSQPVVEPLKATKLSSFGPSPPNSTLFPVCEPAPDSLEDWFCSIGASPIVVSSDENSSEENVTKAPAAPSGHELDGFDFDLFDGAEYDELM